MPSTLHQRPAVPSRLHASSTPDPLRLGRLKVTHPDRVVDVSSNLRKVDLIHYYALVGGLMLPHLKCRPVSLLRAPDGIQGPMFFQKHLDGLSLAGVKPLPQALDPDHAPLMEVNTAKGLLSAAQMNVIEFHTWNAVKSNIAKPDRMVFDLDPGEGVEWPAVQEAAQRVRACLEALELLPFIKTSGGKGLHIVVPLQRRHGWSQVKDVSRAIVVHLAARFPAQFTAKSGPRNRVGKLFIDYLRNGFGATTVCAWSLRARPGLGVSVPIEWTELDSLQGSAQWHLGNIHERLALGNAPWRGYDEAARTLGAAMKTLGELPRE